MESTEGMFHIVNGIVHSCDGNCNELEHWTTLDHALASVGKERITTGNPKIYHAPAEANATRPVPLEATNTVLNAQLNEVPVYPQGTTPADYENSVVNRTYEVDMASFDVGDLLMHDLWLALADHDEAEIIKATKTIMDWSNGLIDGRVHPLVVVKYLFGANDPRGVAFNGKLQRLAADMFCGGWTALQKEIENRWIIPSVTIDKNLGHLKAEFSNPLAYLESTRMAILTMKDAMTGAAIPDLRMMAGGSIRPDAGQTFSILNRWVSNLDQVDPTDGGVTYLPDSLKPEGQLDQALKEAMALGPASIEDNTTTQVAQNFGFSEKMSPLEPMFATWAEGWWRKAGVSESYGAAAWKLARSVWSNPNGPEENPYDHPMACDPATLPIDSGLMRKAMDWFTWVYQNPQVSNWVQQTPINWLDPWRKIPMTGKIDRLNRIFHVKLDANGIPHTEVVSRVLFRDMM